jgi:sialate O-acetylesterase
MPRFALQSVLLCGTGLVAATAMAQGVGHGPTIDTPFGAGMVIQRDVATPVHGTAKPGEAITISFAGQMLQTRADQAGRWAAQLAPHGAGGPFELKLASAQGTTTLPDILVGDVWLCSGQSNMEFTLRHVTNADGEVAGADHPRIRLYNVPEVNSATPLAAPATPIAWAVSSPASAANFSAACYFMGRDLEAKQQTPIGLISAAWGGSVIEDWISRPVLASVPRYRQQLALLDLFATQPAKAHAQWGAWLAQWLGPRMAPVPDAKWRPVPKLSFWEQWGGDTAFFDGIGYYRAHIRLTAAQAGAGEFVLGAADDMDVTRINGAIVGAGQGWNTQRRYPATLRAGDNIVDIAVVDIAGGGGVWGATPYFAAPNGEKIAWEAPMFSLGDDIGKTGMPVLMPWIGGSGRTTLFNGMIAPLHDLPLAGFAWYQGEANVGDPDGYRELLPLLAQDWRARFGAGRGAKLPFIMVQLANFGPLATAPRNDVWGRFRDVQRALADSAPNIGLASAIDIGQSGDIHPTNKQEVGRRLALEARRLALGEAVTGRGPTPVAAVAAPDGIRVRFAGGPLQVVGAGQAIGFELCAAQCRFVEGRVVGDAVLLPADAQASTVRYAWAASPIINLYGPTMLPAGSFTLPIQR